MCRRIALLLSMVCAASGGSLELPGGKLHLRSGTTREWASFPESAQGSSATISFQSAANRVEHTLILRQHDVKKTSWSVSVNGRKLGVLQDDERRMVRVLPIPAGLLRDDGNNLRIEGDTAGFSDDIEIRDIRIEPLPVNDWLSQSTVSIATAGEQGPMPVKISVVDAEGWLMPFQSLLPDAYEARRTGVMYVASGRARIGLPAGTYRIYASRGFDYNAPMEKIELTNGVTKAIQFQLRREVSLAGYVSCDPHVHTFELSRHGDASVRERVLTAAGEGLDLFVSTEHNRVDDYSDVVEKSGLSKWTRVVPGNEVTTTMGHFNIFPAVPQTPQPDPRPTDWTSFMDSLRKTQGVQIIIQNHPRDLHLQYRPFDPARHLFPTGANTQERPVRANGMEVVNSGAMYSDVMQLVRDWMGLLTRGLPIAAIGSSDTHTVDFVPIGQARTYIQADSKEPFGALREGRNLVSYGLAAVISPAREGVEVRVYGPSWSSVDFVQIFSNGTLVWQDTFQAVRKPGLKYRRKVKLELPRHDAAIVAVASGPGVLEPFWEVRKPYQPVSAEWTPRVLGVSQALWLDRDADNRRTAPLAYAEQLMKTSSANLSDLVQQLESYDSTVALHALEFLRTSGRLDTHAQTAFSTASRRLRDTYVSYLTEVGRLRP